MLRQRIVQYYYQIPRTLLQAAGLLRQVTLPAAVPDSTLDQAAAVRGFADVWQSNTSAARNARSLLPRQWPGSERGCFSTWKTVWLAPRCFALPDVERGHSRAADGIVVPGACHIVGAHRSSLEDHIRSDAGEVRSVAARVHRQDRNRRRAGELSSTAA